MHPICLTHRAPLASMIDPMSWICLIPYFPRKILLMGVQIHCLLKWHCTTIIFHNINKMLELLFAKMGFRHYIIPIQIYLIEFHRICVINNVDMFIAWRSGMRQGKARNVTMSRRRAKFAHAYWTDIPILAHLNNRRLVLLKNMLHEAQRLIHRCLILCNILPPFVSRILAKTWNSYFLGAMCKTSIQVLP